MHIPDQIRRPKVGLHVVDRSPAKRPDTLDPALTGELGDGIAAALDGGAGVAKYSWAAVSTSSAHSASIVSASCFVNRPFLERYACKRLIGS